MITKTINLYTIDELKEQYPDGYQKAIEKWREDIDYPFLEDYMTELCIELLEENEIVGKPTVMYDLSYCQGDGAMFEGSFEWKGYTIDIKHSGHYYHYNSKDMSIYDKDGDEIVAGDIDIDFNNLYVEICDKLERAGYKYIEEEREEENILDTIRANEYTFESNGIMNNA